SKSCRSHTSSRKGSATARLERSSSSARARSPPTFATSSGSSASARARNSRVFTSSPLVRPPTTRQTRPSGRRQPRTPVPRPAGCRAWLTAKAPVRRPMDASHPDGTLTAIGNQRERRRWMALALVVTAQFMVILDVTIVNVALPSIQRDLGFARENLQWVITAYTIMFGGTLLLGGRLADLLGRRRLLLVGLALFSVSSLLCGLAWSESSLIAFRAAQGLGAAL